MIATAPCGAMFENGELAVRGHTLNCKYCAAYFKGFEAARAEGVPPNTLDWAQKIVSLNLHSGPTQDAARFILRTAERQSMNPRP